MKVLYSKDEDILTIELIRRKIDDAYETENMIVHIDKDKQPVLLEIFKASKFLKELNQTLPVKIKNKIFTPVHL